MNIGVSCTEKGIILAQMQNVRGVINRRGYIVGNHYYGYSAVVEEFYKLIKFCGG